MTSPSILRFTNLGTVTHPSSPLARKRNLNACENVTKASVAILSPQVNNNQVKNKPLISISSAEHIAGVQKENRVSKGRHTSVARALFPGTNGNLTRAVCKNETPKCVGKVPAISVTESPQVRQNNFPSPVPIPYMDVNSPARLDGTNYVDYPASLVIGKGSFGTVCTGRYRGRKVAVKIMANGKLQPGTIESEKNAWLLNHQHVIQLLLVEELAEYTIIVMEHWGIVNLQYVLDAAPLSFHQAVNYARQVALALEYVHDNAILHLDVKPNNILIKNDMCKLSDFGCSKKLSEPIEMQLQALGTVSYCAPEILRGRVPTTKADVYSYGILLWRLISSRNPFEGENQYVIIYGVVSQKARPKPLPKADQRYTTLYEQCWNADPDARPEMSQILKSLSLLQEKEFQNM